jgi:TnpA family transposase
MRIEKQKLYFALRELGYVVRTMFLLRYVSEIKLRQAVQSATNKSEWVNEFVQPITTQDATDEAL